MRIRRTSYLKDGKPITLPFVSCVADQHPEAAADDTQPFHAGAGLDRLRTDHARRRVEHRPRNRSRRKLN